MGNPFGCSSTPSVPIWDSAGPLGGPAAKTIAGWMHKPRTTLRGEPQTTCSDVESPVRRSTRRVHPRSIRQKTRVRGLTQPLQSRSMECERGRAEVLGTFSARAPGRSAESLVRGLRGFAPLGQGGA